MIIALKEFIAGVDPIAAWGAILSTILVIIKFLEMYLNRSRIELEVDYLFTGDPHEGNYVTIRNLTDTPIIITFWQLIWMRRHWYWWKWKQDRSIDCDPPFFNDIKIKGYSQYELNFSGGDHFEYSKKSLGKNEIYLSLNLAGRSKPIVKKVFG